MIAPLFRPIGSITGRIAAVVIGLTLLAFVAPFVPDASWWPS